MRKKGWILAGLTVCLVLVAGCAGAPGDGTGLEGVWAGTLQTLFDLAGVKLPIPVAPEAKVTFDDGTLTIATNPDIPVIGWMFKLVVDGTYTKDNSTSLSKMTMVLGKASVKLLFIKIPVADLKLTTQAIYTIVNKNTLYFIPGWDKAPEALRTFFEGSPGNVPWEGGSIMINGQQVQVPASLKLDRAK